METEGENEATPDKIAIESNERKTRHICILFCQFSSSFLL